MTGDVGVLTVVLVVLVVLTVRAGRRLTVGAPSSVLAGTVALVGWSVLATVAVAVEVNHQYVQIMATRVVRQVSGQDDAVARCARRTPDALNLSMYSGFVAWDSPHVARLRAQTCSDLSSWLWSSKRSPSLPQIVALHVVVHEAEHVAGVWDEAAAECAAMAADPEVAVSSGAEASTAESMARLYRAQVYPHLAAEYISACA